MSIPDDVCGVCYHHGCICGQNAYPDNQTNTMKDDNTISEAAKAAAYMERDDSRPEPTGHFVQRLLTESNAALEAKVASLEAEGHSPDCDFYDTNLEGIRKPCNCLKWQNAQLRADLAAAMEEARSFGETLQNWFPGLSNAEMFPFERGRFIGRKLHETQKDLAAARQKIEELTTRYNEADKVVREYSSMATDALEGNELGAHPIMSLLRKLSALRERAEKAEAERDRLRAGYDKLKSDNDTVMLISERDTWRAVAKASAADRDAARAACVTLREALKNARLTISQLSFRGSGEFAMKLKAESAIKHALADNCGAPLLEELRSKTAALEIATRSLEIIEGNNAADNASAATERAISTLAEMREALSPKGTQP